MATCNDCLHVGVCYMVEHYGVDETEEGVEHDCRQFQESLRPKGRWVNNADEYPKCNKCGYLPMYDPVIDDIFYSPYCPNCGAKMEG